METDYLIVGAGAGGIGFADTLLSENPNATITIVDERPSPGGHWVDAYDFVQTHQPAALYGVASTPFAREGLDSEGFNAGHHALATGTQVRQYYEDVMQRVLLESGRVRYLPESRYDFDARTITTNGVVTPINARRVVDTTYVAGTIPLRHTPPYEIADGVRHGPVNALSSETAARYVVIGSGKTGMDACVYLLGRGVPPDSITWIKPQDMWLYNRAHYQPGDVFRDTLLEGLAAQMEIAATATSSAEVLLRLEEAGVLLRIDTDVTPTAYRCATITPAEVNELRLIRNVVRLGRVQRLERDRIVLAQGEIPTGPDVLHVDCTAKAIAPKPIVPIFTGDRITVQFVRMCQPAFAAAFVALVEANYEDEAKKNQLCAVVQSPEQAADWLSMSLQTSFNTAMWMREPVLAKWLATSRLNATRGAMKSKDEMPAAHKALRERIRAATPAAAVNLARLVSDRC